jgi:hypothetical protein
MTDQLLRSRALSELTERRFPFVVAGTHALNHYTGVVRATKDLDLFVRREEIDDILEALAEAGHRTELTYPHWLGKVYDGDSFVDVIFSSGNGLSPVDEDFFRHASDGVLFLRQEKPGERESHVAA